jgi:hypothetical protein
VGVSDRALFLELVARGQEALARDFLNVLAQQYREMVRSYIEWVSALAHAMRESAAGRYLDDALRRSFASASRPVTDKVLRCFIHHLATLASGDENLESLSAILKVVEVAIEAERRQVLQDAASGDVANGFDHFAGVGRNAHDLLVDTVQTLADIAVGLVGQARSEDLLAGALGTCSFYEGFWSEVERRSPAELVTFLAQEFRAHWSGPGREGSVQILEDELHYRLVLNPCGSGGAMRQRRASSQPQAMKHPSGQNQDWSNSGPVPAYCSHCRQNELISIRRLGYCAWVTAFDPDPAMPCGWVVFKRPAQVAAPANYTCPARAT